MTLRTRLLFGSGLVGLCLLVVSVTTVMTLVGVSQSMDHIEEEYEEHGSIGTIREMLRTAHALVNIQATDHLAVIKILERTLTLLDAYLSSQFSQEVSSDEHQAEELATAQQARTLVTQIQSEFLISPINTTKIDTQFTEADQLLTALFGDTDEQISHVGGQADTRLRYGLFSSVLRSSRG